MSWAARLHVARIHYVDREGSQDAVQMYFSSADSKSGLLSALEAETAFQAVSDCTMCAISLTCSAVYMLESTANASNLNNGVLSFTTDGDGAVVLNIPGLREEYYVTDGCFKTMQIDIENTDIVTLAGIIIDNGVCTPDELPALALCTGHRAMIWSNPTRKSG